MIATALAIPDGTVQGLYTEAIDLTLVGHLRIARASTIEFDNPAQLWRVFDRRGRCIHSAVSRTECLEASGRTSDGEKDGHLPPPLRFDATAL